MKKIENTCTEVYIFHVDNIFKCTPSGVDILPHARINIVETNKHFGKRWKGIRKIQHL